MERPHHSALQPGGSAAGLTAAELSASPAWFPLELAGADRLKLVRLDEAAYRAASFLDQRILRESPQETACPLAIAAEAARRLGHGAHFIFHIGHVGSTLLSRLTGEHPALFSVREPALLRVAAVEPARAGVLSLRDLQALLSRTWRPDQRALIKATSFVSDLAQTLLETDGQSKAVFMFSSPLAYLRCILGGPNSRVEARALAQSRLARLRRRLGEAAPDFDPRSEGEWIAMSWLTEMTALGRAAAELAPRILWVDFDTFLAAPAEGLERVFRALGAAPHSQQIQTLLSGSLMRQYSKAPQYAYDTALRRSVLETAQRQYAAEIRRGMDWLARLAGRHPLIDQALAR